MMMASSFVMKRLLGSKLVTRSVVPFRPGVTRSSRFLNTDAVTVGDCDFTEDNRVAFDMYLDVTMHIEGEVHGYDGFNCVTNFSLAEDIKTSDYSAKMKNGVLKVTRKNQGKVVKDVKEMKGKGKANEWKGKAKESNFTCKDIQLFPSRKMNKFSSNI